MNIQLERIIFRKQQSSSMPIRNPFRKAGAEIYADENARPNSHGGADRGFHKADVVGSKQTSAVDIKAKDAPEYKLSGKSSFRRS